MHYELVWSNADNLPEWDPSKYVELEAEAVPTTREGRKSNTRKDSDKRLNRHTCGIFIG